MKRPLTDPSVLKPHDVDALHVLDDDGNPWHPPEPDAVSRTRWAGLAQGKLDDATRVLRDNSLVAMAVALGAGYLIGRALAARSS